MEDLWYLKFDKYLFKVLTTPPKKINTSDQKIQSIKSYTELFEIYIYIAGSALFYCCTPWTLTKTFETEKKTSR